MTNPKSHYVKLTSSPYRLQTMIGDKIKELYRIRHYYCASLVMRDEIKALFTDYYTLQERHYVSRASLLAALFNRNKNADQKHKDEMEAAAVTCERLGTAAAADDAARAAAAAAAAAARDRVIGLMAEAGVQALILSNSPGCAWLDLCPL